MCQAAGLHCCHSVDLRYCEQHSKVGHWASASRPPRHPQPHRRRLSFKPRRRPQRPLSKARRLRRAASSRQRARCSRKRRARKRPLRPRRRRRPSGPIRCPQWHGGRQTSSSRSMCSRSPALRSRWVAALELPHPASLLRAVSPLRMPCEFAHRPMHEPSAAVPGLVTSGWS